MKLYTLLLLIVLGNSSFAQNLVQNGDFESYSSCPYFFAPFNQPDYWITPSDGTPDYYNSCDAGFFNGAPINIAGYQIPHSGNAYTGIILYFNGELDVREYIENTLLTTLQADVCYHFEMYVNLADGSWYTTKDLQVYISDTSLLYFTDYRVVNKPYQIEYLGAEFDSTSNWMQFTGDYVAHGGEKYLIIGNFKTDAQSNFTYIQDTPLNPLAYVLMDDISLTQTCALEFDSSPAIGIPKVVKNKVPFSIYPNPFISKVTLEVSNSLQTSFSLYDEHSKEILSKEFTSSCCLDVEELKPGMYFYMMKNCNGIISSGTLVKK